MAGYVTDKGSGERRYLSDNDLARIASDQSRNYSLRAVEANKEADGKMAQYSKLRASKTYKNPRTVTNIEKLRQEAADLYEISADYSRKASRAETQVARALAKSDESKRIKTIVHRHEGNALTYLADAKTAEQKRGAIIREMGEGRDEEGELEEILDGKSMVFPILAMLAFFFALISSSFSITGFLISDTTNSVANYITLGCFLAGLIIAIFYMRKVIKDKMKEKVKKSSKKRKSKAKKKSPSKKKPKK